MSVIGVGMKRISLPVGIDSGIIRGEWWRVIPSQNQSFAVVIFSPSQFF